MKKENEAEKKTAKELAELEKKIAKIYSRTAKELKKEIEDYFEGFAEGDAKKREQLDAEEISKEEYKQWRLKTMCQGKKYEALRNRLAKKYLKANQEADELINHGTTETFALNYNYTLYKIEQIVNHAGKL